jgi:hypothetical protein
MKHSIKNFVEIPTWIFEANKDDPTKFIRTDKTKMRMFNLNTILLVEPEPQSEDTTTHIRTSCGSFLASLPYEDVKNLISGGFSIEEKESGEDWLTPGE